MKKIINKLLFIALLSTMFFTSCDEALGIYELRFTSTSDNPYEIEVNGETDIIQGNSYITYKFSEGVYDWKVTQQSGYVLYPTVKEGTVNLDEDREIVFP